MDRPSPIRLVAFLTLGIASVSCGSLFIRLAAAPALVVAFYRVGWATLLIAPLLGRGPLRELRGLTHGEWVRLTLAGVALALHFALWIASLDYTSVASSVVLVDTAPFFIGLAGHLFLRRPSPRRFWIGLTAAFLGCLVIFQGDWSHSTMSMKGNALALGGAVAVAIYLIIGAEVRQKLSLFSYVWPVYATAALALVAVCLASATPLRGFSGTAYLYMFLVGLIPQCVGHTVYNWSLRWLSPALVVLIGLAEPVGASLLALMFLHENLTLSKTVGGCIILIGIYLATGPASKS